MYKVLLWCSITCYCHSRQSVRQGSHTSNTTVRCFEAQGVFEDAEFSAKLRPIVLAGQLERHKIIDLLIERNFTDGIHPLTRKVEG